VGNKFAFRQNASGLYMGRTIHENAPPGLTDNKKDWELFTLENRGNGVVIKSHTNAYLTEDGNSLKWKSNPSNLS